MIKDKIKYAYFDMDGTLLNSNKEILDTTIEALDKLKTHNIKYGIITGRPIYMIKKTIDLIKPNLPTITINGAAINHVKGKMVSFQKIKTNIKNIIGQFMVKNNIPFIAYGQNKMLFYEKKLGSSQYIKYMHNKNNSLYQRYQWDFEHWNDNKDIDIAKFLCFRDEMNDANWNKFNQCIKNNDDEIYGVFSQSNLFDIVNNQSAKGKALRKLNNNQTIDLEQTIVFGDSYNDISMFKEAKFSVALSNSVEALKQFASHVELRSNDDHGINDFIINNILGEEK